MLGKRLIVFIDRQIKSLRTRRGLSPPKTDLIWTGEEGLFCFVLFAVTGLLAEEKLRFRARQMPQVRQHVLHLPDATRDGRW